MLAGVRTSSAFKGAAINAVKREFVQVVVAPAPDVRVRDERLEVELSRGALTISFTGPMCAAADSATWTRELLR